jgi:hypothetical protein
MPPQRHKRSAQPVIPAGAKSLMLEDSIVLWLPKLLLRLKSEEP